MSDDNPIDLNSPEIQAAIKAAVDAEVTGLKNKNSELLDSLKLSKTELNNFKAQFEGVDIESIKALTTKMKQDEELQMFAQGKHEEVFNRKIEPLKQSYEQKLQEYEQKLKQRDSRALKGSIESVVASSGIHKDTWDGVSAVAKTVFNSLDDDLNPIAKDANGEVIYSATGKPLTPTEWLASYIEERPYLQGLPQGAGSRGGQGGQADKKPSDYTEQERIALSRENPELFRQLFR